MSQPSEPSPEITPLQRHPLEAIFNPKSVAIIGATEKAGSVGRTVFENLMAGSLKDSIYPVTPRNPQVFGRKAYPSVGDIPCPIDLAVIVTPSKTVPGLITECVNAGIPSAVIISAGFKEAGPEGIELERQILANAAGRMRIIGPNCLGVMSPHAGFNATFAATAARPGNVAFLSQSGALCTAILDWSLSKNVGFSAFASLGSMLDIDWGDLITFLGNDPQTKSITMYMETIGDARAFLSAAREVALTKPIVVIKVGRTEQAAKAAASHTGSLTGNDEVLDAAFERAGVLRVNTIAELFDMTEALSKQPLPAGPRLAIVTNAGGPAALSTDRLVSDGGKIAELTPETLASLNAMLPPFWSHGNPVDILGDANGKKYADAVALVDKDTQNDGTLVILTPQAMTEATATAEHLKAMSRVDGKPIFASWMGGSGVKAGEDILNEASIPTYAHPDTAARVFCSMWRYSDNLRALYETPSLVPESEVTAQARESVAQTLEKVRQSGRTILTEVEAKEVLATYGIPIVPTCIALSEEEAVALAQSVGGPVVLKIHSETITHKTDVGGVKLNLQGDDAVRKAWREIKESVTEKGLAEHFLGVTVQAMIKFSGSYEIILGSSTDPQFGPVLLFGTGGQLVEIFKDRALGLPPLNSTLARRLMERTRIYEALKGVRGRKAIDLAALEQLLVRFSQLVAEQPWIAEIDINPLMVSPEGFVALDARVVVHGQEIQTPLQAAIRPYPRRYVSSWTAKNGTPVTIRPIRSEDEPLLVKFHQTLSENSVKSRWGKILPLDVRIAHQRLSRICSTDYDWDILLVADRTLPDSIEHQILGVGQLRKTDVNEAVFTLLISDDWQGQGLGARLLELLLNAAREEQCTRVTGRIQRDSLAMRNLSEKMGFTLSATPDAGEYKVELVLKA